MRGSFWIRIRDILKLFIVLPRAADRYGCSIFAIWKRAIVLYFRLGIGPIRSVANGLINPRLSAAVDANAVDFSRLTRNTARITPKRWESLVEDKAILHFHCSAYGLPQAKLYAVFSPTSGWTEGDPTINRRADWVRFFDDDLPSEFIVKHALGGHGYSVNLYRRKGNAFEDFSGRNFSSSSLYDALQNSRNPRFVIQERLFNDPEILRLTAMEALQTARIATWISENGEFEYYLTFFKFITGEKKIVDNFSGGLSGNMLADIDRETGMLAPAIARSLDGIGYKTVAVHPTTGVAIQGMVLPHWQSALALAARAARICWPLRTSGWDIALTPAGPVLVEGNIWWETVPQLIAIPEVSEKRRAELARVMRRMMTEP